MPAAVAGAVVIEEEAKTVLSEAVTRHVQGDKFALSDEELMPAVLARTCYKELAGGLPLPGRLAKGQAQPLFCMGVGPKPQTD